MAYPYQALKPEMHEIRLLTLHPDKSAEAYIRGSLQTASLKNNIQFEALSYVWGDVHLTEAISVEHADFQVTGNLACALRRLRYESRPRVLWVDFICIDQSNITERNSQVLLMREIYVKASRVVAFLGESTLRIDRGFSWLDRYIHKRVNRGALYWWKLEIKAVFSVSARREKQTATVLAHNGLTDLQRLAYWTRMWTFQEYHLPADEPISICGSHVFKASMPCSELLEQILDTFEVPINALIEGIGSLPSPVRAVYKTGTDGQGTEELHGSREVRSHRDKTRDIEHWESIRDLMAWAGRGEHHFFTHREKGYVDTPYGKTWLLSALLLQTCHHSCTDPRDKFFALYGLVPAAQDAFPPDYNKPVEQVLREVTAFIMSHDVAASIYYVFPLRENHLQDDSLPSWVPDYKRNREDAKEQDTFLRVGDSLRTSIGQNKPRVLPGFSTLSLWARCVGTCQVLFRFDTTWTEVVRNIIEVLDTTDHVLWRTTWDSRTVRERFVRACFSHSNLCDEYSMDEIMNAMREICRKSFKGYRHINCFEQLRDDLDCMYGRPVLLIETKSGYGFGLSGMPVESGDLAIYTDSAVQSFIIRKKSTDKPLTHYQLVGPAFVDGLEEEQLPNYFSDEFTGQPYEEFLIN